MLLAGIWLVLPLAALVAQSSSIYLHYLVALFPAVFLVMALPIGWLLAHGPLADRGARRGGAAGSLVIFQLVTTGLVYRRAGVRGGRSAPGAAGRCARRRSGCPREASNLLGTGERYGVELPIRFWQALATAHDRRGGPRQRSGCLGGLG